MLNSILMGSTGFVGSNLARARNYSLQVNSKTASQALNRSCDRLVCAAAPGSMAFANKNPEKDDETVSKIIDLLDTITAEEFILISTIGVLSDFGAALNEDRSDFETERPYGINRRRLEEYCLNRGGHVIRLPALFGPGLKKNFLFDLLNPVPSFFVSEAWASLLKGAPEEVSSVLKAHYALSSDGRYYLAREKFNASEHKPLVEAYLVASGQSGLRFHHAETSFQFYDLSALDSHIDLTVKNQIKIMHLSTEPIQTSEIYEAFHGSQMPATKANLHKENMKTKYDGLFPTGGDGYIEQAETLLPRVIKFLRSNA